MRYCRRFPSGITHKRVDDPRVTHPYATLLILADFLVRLACVKRAASVDSEPGSNSRLNRLGQPTFAPRTPLRDRSGYLSIITDVFDRFDLKLKY